MVPFLILMMRGRNKVISTFEVWPKFCFGLNALINFKISSRLYCNSLHMTWCNGYQTLAKQIKTWRKSLQKHYNILEDSNLNLFLSHSYVFPQFFLFLIPSMHQKTIGLRVKAFLGKEKGRKAITHGLRRVL
jgi:hypothetical protein